MGSVNAIGYNSILTVFSSYHFRLRNLSFLFKRDKSAMRRRRNSSFPGSRGQEGTSDFIPYSLASRGSSCCNLWDH